MKIYGMSMTGTVMIEAVNITVIDMIVITPPAIIGGGMTNEETMQIRIGVGRDIRTTDATIKNGMLEERSVGNRHQWEPDRNITGVQSEQRSLEEPNQAIFGFQPGNTAEVETSNTWKVYCYYCRKDGHYNNYKRETTDS